LQQYHTIFVRVGFLLAPYIEAKNAANEDGKTPAREGVRVVDLYNAGIGYHQCNPKHQGRELVLSRDAADDSGRKVALVLLNEHGRGVLAVPTFEEDGTRGTVEDLGPATVRKVVRRAERALRPSRPWYWF
jgi:hypothetical protein